MSAHYDHYDYPSYWKNREYEHLSEVVALKSFLKKIPKVKSLVDIGAGYGRLTEEYVYRAKRVILSDPSAKLLKIAREKFGERKNIEFLQTKLENLDKKVRKNSFDLIILIRVMHHIENPQEAFQIINKITKKGGFLILEYANKSHFKAIVKEFFKGNFTFPIDIFPKDIRCAKNIRKKTIPFINHHPDKIKKILEDCGFKIIEKRSVSNFRSPIIKKFFPIEFLVELEEKLQPLMQKINFGPSIFILAKKVSKVKQNT